MSKQGRIRIDYDSDGNVINRYLYPSGAPITVPYVVVDNMYKNEQGLPIMQVIEYEEEQLALPAPVKKIEE